MGIQQVGLRSHSQENGEAGMSAWECTGRTDDWYTPAYIFDAMECRFDLDVAAPEVGPRHVPAHDFISSGSLQKQWKGFVWMNPPYGGRNQLTPWLSKFIRHGNGVALVPDRTSAPWWQMTAPNVDAILFVSRKIKFERPDGSLGRQPGTGSTLIAVGNKGRIALMTAMTNKLGALFVPDIVFSKAALQEEE